MKKEDFRMNHFIHCDTQEKVKKICELFELDKQFYTNNYNRYTSRYCIRPIFKSFSELNFYLKDGANIQVPYENVIRDNYPNKVNNSYSIY